MSYLVFSKGYNTSVVASTPAAAVRKAKRLRPNAAIRGRPRKATPSEQKTINAGGWVRTRYDGSKPKPWKGPRGHGPSASASRKAVANRRAKRR